MGQDQGTKIRTIPRKNEKAKAKETATDAKPSAPRWIIYVGVTSVILLMATLFLDLRPPAKVQKTEMASVRNAENEKVSRLLQESYMHRQLMVQAQQIENMKMKNQDLKAEDYALDPNRTYGVQFDQEDSADRVYEDLNDRANVDFERTPAEEISARLANRRWVNELERRERVTFVKNFVRSAYERGYEVQLDQNLVVVGVRKITENRKINIDQLIDKLAAQQGY